MYEGKDIYLFAYAKTLYVLDKLRCKNASKTRTHYQNITYEYIDE